MFTGIIEKCEEVISVIDKESNRIIKVKLPQSFDDVNIGDSIAINGCCLTVIELSDDFFCFDVLKQSMELTNISLLQSGDFVNLERAMLLSKRLDGHIVQGHVDYTAEVISIEKIEKSSDYKLEIAMNSDLVVEKGSICINGVSLTVAEIQDDNIIVYLIPFTFQNTNLKDIKNGSKLNIEYDIVGKYILRSKSFNER